MSLATGIWLTRSGPKIRSITGQFANIQEAADQLATSRYSPPDMVILHETSVHFLGRDY